MQIIIRGKNLDITPQMRAQAERKLARLVRHAPDIILAEVEYATEHTRSVVDREIVRMNLELPGADLHAEERAATTHVALDAVVDKLLDQLEELHSRRIARHHGRIPPEPMEEEEVGPTYEEYEAETPPPIEPTADQERHPGTG